MCSPLRHRNAAWVGGKSDRIPPHISRPPSPKPHPNRIRVAFHGKKKKTRAHHRSPVSCLFESPSPPMFCIVFGSGAAFIFLWFMLAATFLCPLCSLYAFILAVHDNLCCRLCGETQLSSTFLWLPNKLGCDFQTDGILRVAFVAAMNVEATALATRLLDGWNCLHTSPCACPST